MNTVAIPHLISQRATVAVNTKTKEPGIAGLKCKYRPEGKYLRTYVLKQGTWHGPYYIQASDLSDAH